MPRFTDGELEVMRVLWKHGEMKPAEIQAEFPREIKNPALRSYLTILLEKGHVTRRLKGKAYHYKAKTSRESAFRATYRMLADTFCDGSTESLLCRLIKSENLSDAELLELKRLADEERSTSQKSKAKTDNGEDAHGGE
jgi:BlaI family penicillinase repressor